MYTQLQFLSANKTKGHLYTSARVNNMKTAVKNYNMNSLLMPNQLPDRGWLNKQDTQLLTLASSGRGMVIMHTLLHLVKQSFKLDSGQ